MQKILITLAAVVVLGGSVWYVVDNGDTDEVEHMSGEKMTDERSDETMTKSESSDTRTGMGSFLSLVGMGDSIRCEFESTVEGVVSNGTFYTDGSQYRVDATTMMDGDTFDTNVIEDGTYTYIWNTSANGQSAIKMSNQEMIDTDDSMPADDTPPTSFDADQDVQYTCDSWSADASIFIPPSDIEFLDMAAMMQAATQDMPEEFALPVGF